MKKITLSILSIAIAVSSFAQQKVNFTEKFKKQNQGKYKIEINELKELIHIMIAITNSGKENDDMIEQKGQYYQDLRSYFKPFENEPIIRTFDSLMVSSPYNYIFLTGNAISYKFKGDQLINSEVFVFPAQAMSKTIKIDKNPITTYKTKIEAFAKKTKFRKFYSDHKPFYKGMISDYEKKANLAKQWKWLENNFETKKDTYLILCSPLINGLNYTTQFNNNNFSLIYMSLPPVDNDQKLTPLENELLNTRVMFTEIDHNYVSAPTGANKELINKIFADRKTWVDEKTPGTFAYPDPVKVFDEYMTYGVFVLYCKDHYDDATLQKVIKDINFQMMGRGFTKMKIFIEKLMQSRAANPNQKIDQWYPQFIKQFTE